jgi:hypothetical protein
MQQLAVVLTGKLTIQTLLLWHAHFDQLTFERFYTYPGAHVSLRSTSGSIGQSCMVRLPNVPSPGGQIRQYEHHRFAWKIGWLAE